jgi:hypothetical protein
MTGQGEQMTGAHFEISIDGKPRTYRDTREMADQAAAVLRRQYPNSDVVVRDLRLRPAGPNLQ